MQTDLRNAVLQRCLVTSLSQEAGVLTHLADALKALHGAGALSEQTSSTPAFVTRVGELVKSKNVNARYAGLVLLDCVVRTCDQPLLEKHAPTWTTQALSLMRSSEPLTSREAASAAYIAIVERCEAWADLRRDALSHLPRYASLLADLIKSGASVPALEQLDGLMGRLTTSLRGQRKVLESTVLGLLDSPNDEIREAATGCCGGLPLVDGTAEWCSQYVKRIVSSMHGCLAEAYASVESGSHQPSSLVEPLPASYPVSSDRADAVTMRFETLGRLVVEVLRAGVHPQTTVPVVLPLSALVAVALRALGVDGTRKPTAPSDNWDYQWLVSAVPRLHVAALNLLAGLAPLLGSALLPHAVDISVALEAEARLAVQPKSLASAGPVKLALFNAIRAHSITFKTGVPASMLAAAAPLLLRESQPLAVSLTATAANDAAVSDAPAASGGKKGGKGKPQATVARVAPTAPSQDLLCNKALETLSAVLLSSGGVMDDALMEDVEHSLVSIASQPRPVWPRPYCNAQVRRSLYNALATLLVVPRGRIPTVMPLCAIAFRRGLTDACPEIALACARALATTELIVHPRGAPAMAEVDSRHPVAREAPVGPAARLLGEAAMINTFAAGRPSGPANGAAPPPAPAAASRMVQSDAPAVVKPATFPVEDPPAQANPPAAAADKPRARKPSDHGDDASKRPRKNTSENGDAKRPRVVSPKMKHKSPSMPAHKSPTVRSKAQSPRTRPEKAKTATPTPAPGAGEEIPDFDLEDADNEDLSSASGSESE